MNKIIKTWEEHLGQGYIDSGADLPEEVAMKFEIAELRAYIAELESRPAAPVVAEGLIPTVRQILDAAEQAGLWPNTVHSWIPAFMRYHAILAAHPVAGSPAEPIPAGEAAIGAGDPMAFFADFCDREGYPSDGEMDAALRASFYEGIRYCAAHTPTAAPVPASEAATLPRLYRFDRINKGRVMAEGIGVHAATMEEAEGKARKMMYDDDEAIKFRSNEPCHKSRKCSICAAFAAPAAPIQASEAASVTETKMTTEEAREYLVKFMERNFNDTTYHRYIRGRDKHCALAGDFAWQMARALRRLAATAAPTDAKPNWWGSLAQVIMDIPLPERNDKYQSGFVDAKQAILQALRGAGFDRQPAAQSVRDAAQSTIAPGKEA